MGGGDFVLFEAASGFGLFEVLEFEEIGSSTEQMQQTVADLQKFSRLVKLKVCWHWSYRSSCFEA
jgi:nucleolar protein 56